MTETTSDTSALFGTDDFFLRDNYAPVEDELTEFDLPVEGAIPAELDGWYLRNGPNPRQATAHWFTGDGMIHGFYWMQGVVDGAKRLHEDLAEAIKEGLAAPRAVAH